MSRGVSIRTAIESSLGMKKAQVVVAMERYTSNLERKSYICNYKEAVFVLKRVALVNDL